MTLRLLEHYVSTQGEGPRVGELTQFVRFAGCNLKCALWPCDSPYAIDPKVYRGEQEFIDPLALTVKIRQLYVATGATNICFTGGEPLIQPTSDILKVISWLQDQFGFFKFEMFTNGTRQIDEALADECNFVMDWKLPGSGEDMDDLTRIQNLKVIDTLNNAIKFTVANVDDLNCASGIWTNHLMESPVQVYCGAVWGKVDNTTIVDFIKTKRLPWKLNVQVHNYIYGGPTVRGI